MILAAGKGERLRPLTTHTPKPLLRAGGAPLIAYGLTLLRQHGFDRAVINVHHLGRKIMDELGDGSRFGIQLDYSIEPTLLDTGGGIRNAASRLVEAGPILVMNGDIVTDVPLGPLLEAHRARGAAATLVLRSAPDADRYGLLGIDTSGRVRRFLGEGAPEHQVDQYMFASVQVLEAKYLAAMPAAGVPFSITRDFYASLMRHDEPIFGWIYDGPWYTADTVEDLSRLDQLLSTPGTLSHSRNFPWPATIQEE